MMRYKKDISEGVEITKTFIIRNKETKQLWIADSGKSSWKKPAHAKNAWKLSSKNIPSHLRVYAEHNGRVYSWKETVRFDDQDMFEILEVIPEEIKAKDKALEKLETISKIIYQADEWCRDQGNEMTEGNICISAMKDIKRILGE